MIELTGAVLCGGLSTRMGADKAALELLGKPMARWVAEALRAGGVDEVIALGGTDSAGLEVLADLEPGLGPLAVLIGAIERRGDVLVCPCDVPGIEASAVAALIDRAEASDRPVVLAHSSRLEPLIGIYRHGA
ncbi:MAG: molybdenum cofactor guanylyltransferase, partial [Actinomycetota bacterium]|nr:molybdenum cofactor guanylyltransferase [Actinomycetota bacterium]